MYIQPLDLKSRTLCNNLMERFNYGRVKQKAKNTVGHAQKVARVEGMENPSVHSHVHLTTALGIQTTLSLHSPPCSKHEGTESRPRDVQDIFGKGMKNLSLVSTGTSTQKGWNVMPLSSEC